MKFIERFIPESCQSISGLVIFKSQMYFDIKRPPAIACPTIGGHFILRYFFVTRFYQVINDESL